MSPERLVEFVRDLNQLSHWCITKGDGEIHVTVDRETSFGCLRVERALETAVKAGHARDHGALDAIRSLRAQFRSEQGETTAA